MIFELGFKRFRFFHSFLLLLFTIFTIQNAGHAQDTRPIPSHTPASSETEEVIRVDSDLVTVPVTVMDHDGRYVTNLTKDDFQILENGIEQETAFLESIAEPFTVLLLLDNSGSMRPYMSNLAEAASEFVKQMRPNDRLIVATFSDSAQIQIIVQPTPKGNLSGQFRLSARIGDGFTTTFNAVERGIKYMKSIQGRRSIVLFSDGEMYGIRSSAKSNLRVAQEQESIIYTVRFGEFPTHQPGYTDYASERDHAKLSKGANKYLCSLADITGGRCFDLLDIADLTRTFGLIVDELGRQYSLGYYPKNKPKAGERREIKVRVKQPGMAVRARESYVVGKTKSK